MVLLGAVLAMCAPSGLVHKPAANAVEDTFGVGVAGLVAAVAPPADSSAAVAAGIVDDRVRPTRPNGQDLAETQPAVSQLAVSVTRRSAIALTDATPTPPIVVGERSTTGAVLAVGAPDVSRRGGIGAAMTASNGSGGSGSAMVPDPVGRPVDDGVPPPRLIDRAAEMHASIKPLVRPG